MNNAQKKHRNFCAFLVRILCFLCGIPVFSLCFLCALFVRNPWFSCVFAVYFLCTFRVFSVCFLCDFCVFPVQFLCDFSVSSVRLPCALCAFAVRFMCVSSSPEVRPQRVRPPDPLVAAGLDRGRWIWLWPSDPIAAAEPNYGRRMIVAAAATRSDCGRRPDNGRRRLTES